MKVRVLLVLGRFVFRNSYLKPEGFIETREFIKGRNLNKVKLYIGNWTLKSSTTPVFHYFHSYLLLNKLLHKNYPGKLPSIGAACFCFTKNSLLLKSIKVLLNTTLVYVLEGCVRLIMLKFGVSGLELVCSFYWRNFIACAVIYCCIICLLNKTR